MQHQQARYNPIVAHNVEEDDTPHTGAFVFITLSWLISGLGAALPIANDFGAKLVLLLPPVIISILFTLLSPSNGFALWSIGLGFLVTQTGYQIDIGNIRSSALELILVVLGLILLWHRRRASNAMPTIPFPGRVFLLLFTAYSTILFVISLIQRAPLQAALLEFKGFLLYPFMAYIVAAGLRTVRLVRWSIGIVVFWYIYVAAQGIRQFVRGEQGIGWSDLFRASGDYAPINTYGITLGAICLLVVGIAVYSSDKRLKLIFGLIATWLFLGSVVSVSRTVWIACASGMMVLLLSGKKAGYAISVILFGIVLFSSLPTQVSGRIDQFSDSSTEKRQFYFESGLRSWEARWLTGWSWGSAYWYYPGVGLVPTSDGVAWYHNDYLNLAAQTGVIGVALYVGYWLQTLLATNRWYKDHADSPMSGYVRGAQLALVVLLVSAGFEHVLWKPDIAGLVGWVCGLMLACMRLHDDEALQPRAA